MKKQRKYKPNEIPRRLRTWYIISSIVLISYGTYCVANNAMYLPAKRRITPLAIHGFPMWFTYLAFLSASANLISVVIDHYDRRDNEINYKKFAAITSKLGWFSFAMSILLILLFALAGKVI